ncbi:MAG: hypothetical protein M0Z95_06380 [Actinomycetota bacterium]|nr:hypothetical protein [Actinomycetota bacterium]
MAGFLWRFAIPVAALNRARAQGFMTADLRLERGLLVRGDDEGAVLQGLTLPGPGVQLEHTRRLRLEVGVSWKDPGAVLPTSRKHRGLDLFSVDRVSLRRLYVPSSSITTRDGYSWPAS